MSNAVTSASSTVSAQQRGANGAPVFVGVNRSYPDANGNPVEVRVETPAMQAPLPPRFYDVSPKKAEIDLSALMAKTNEFLAQPWPPGSDTVPAWQKKVDALKGQIEANGLLALNAGKSADAKEDIGIANGGTSPSGKITLG